MSNLNCRVLIEWNPQFSRDNDEHDENWVYRNKDEFPTTLMTELRKLTLIPFHIREVLSDFSKVI